MTLRICRALLLSGVLASGFATDPWSALTAATALKDSAESRKAIEALLLDNPGFHAAHFNLGTMLMASDADAASKHLETATGAAVPDLAADARFNLALLRYQQGKLAEAVTDADAALKLRPDHAETRQLLDELRRVLLVRQDEARRKAEEEAKKLGLATTQLPEAHVAEDYDQRIPAKGGAGGYRFAMGTKPAPQPATPAAQPAAPPTVPLRPGAQPSAPAANTPPATVPAEPPPGLALDSDGRLHGTPQQAGSFDIPLVIEDEKKERVTATVKLTVLPAPFIITTELPEGVTDIGYIAELACSGLNNPRWSVEGLPAGLESPSAHGATVKLAGTPRAAGDFTLNITAQDAKRTAKSVLKLHVVESFAPDATRLPPATAWADYTHKVGVRGPVQDYRWQATAQGGLAIAADGTVSGKPDKAGEAKLDVTITAADGKTRTSTLAVPVNPPPVIQEPQPIEMIQGQAQSRPLKVEGGTPPYAWSVAEGTLPKGLRLDADGTLRGSASDPGQTEVTVALSDRWKAGTQQKVTVSVKPNEKPPPQDQQQKQDQQQQQQAGQQQNQPQSGKDQEQQKREQQAQEQQAEQLNKAATDRWLDQLKEEDRDKILRYQLLDGGERKAVKREKPW